MAQRTPAPYRPLAKLFYMDDSPERFSALEARAAARLEADGTFRTGLATATGELFIAVPRELSLIAERVLRRERAISLAFDRLPGIARKAILDDLMVEEVVSSNGLERVRSTKRQVIDSLKAERSGNRRRRPHRFAGFAQLYEDIAEQRAVRPKTPAEIRAIYDRVMSGEELGEIAVDGGLFRRGGVDIVGDGGTVIHSGIEGEAAIEAALRDLLAFADDPDVPALYSAIASHFYFEYVHPFYDGNGRCGRYLLALYLSRPLSPLTSLSLSKTLYEHGDAYYRSFREAEKPMNHAELTFFVMNILENIQEAQALLENRLARAREALAAARETLAALKGEGRLTEREATTLYLFAQRALFVADGSVSWDLTAEYLGLSRQTVRKTLAALEERGYLSIVTRRPLSYELDEGAARALGLGR